jgi:hypothetical protein
MAACTFDLRQEFHRIRQNGFPVYSLNRDEKRDELRNLLRYDHTGLIKEGVVGQAMNGLALAWHYQPHSWEVACGKRRTPMDVFTDDDRLRRAIKKCRKADGPPTDADVRRVLRSANRAQGVSNFRPTAAASIYDRFLPNHGGVVWNMSAGFGGRLLGAFASARVTKYIGTDPASLTMDGLREMATDVAPMVRRLGYTTPEIVLHQCGSEEFTPAPNSLSLCATSPPYGANEKYSDEPTQSYIKFPSKQEWLHGFIGRTLRNCRIGLKSEGKLVINIAGVNCYPNLHIDFLALAQASGWVLEETLYLRLSMMPGIRRGSTGTHKLEPIYVFHKAGSDE